MARIRSIKVDQFLDDGLMEVSLEAHFLLLGLPCLADSAGRLEDRPRKIQALLFAYRPHVKLDAILSELVRSGHIQRYTVDGEAYIQVLDWDRDQRPHKNEPESFIPPPPQKNTDVGHVAVPGIPESTQGIPEEKSAAGVLGVGSGVLDPDPSFPPPASASAPPEQAGLPGVVPPTPPDKPAKRPREKKPDAPAAEPAPFKAACDMLTRVYAEVRKADYGFGLDATRNGKAVRELLWGAGAKAGEDRGEPLAPLDEIERRWRIGLARQFPPRVNAIWDLKAHWAACAQPETGGRPPPVPDVRRGGVRAELMDHTKPQGLF